MTKFLPSDVSAEIRTQTNRQFLLSLRYQTPVNKSESFNVRSKEARSIDEVTIACVASVSVGFGSKERDFWCFARAENGERTK